MRRQSFFTRTTRWLRRHRLVLRAVVVLGGAVASWACEYAPPTGRWAALCRLRVQVKEHAGAAVEQLLQQQEP